MCKSHTSCGLVQIINIQDIIRVPSIEEMKDMYVRDLFSRLVLFVYSNVWD